MASWVALRRAVNSPAMFNSLRGISAASGVANTRCFNTNAQMTRFEDDDHQGGGVDVGRRGDRFVSRRRDSFPSFFSDDVFDPLSPSRSVNQLLNLMDQLMDNPFTSASRGIGAGSRLGWDVREDESSLHLRMDMPGLDKENVKISVEESTLVIKGECEKESEEEEHGRRYSSRLDLPPNLYKVEGIKAEMKNGVLKVVVPKVKEDEKKDVVQVKIE